MSPSSLPSLLSEPKSLPSFIAFEPQCLPLSFPSWPLGCAAFRLSHSVSAKMGLVVLPRWLPHCIVFEPRFAVSVHSARAKRKMGSTAFVWCAWDRICVGTGHTARSETQSWGVIATFYFLSFSPSHSCF